jgi:hypothetical protein
VAALVIRSNPPPVPRSVGFSRTFAIGATRTRSTRACLPILLPAADPQICIEFRTDADMDLFTLNFAGGSRLLDSPTLDFAVDFTV